MPKGWKIWGTTAGAILSISLLVATTWDADRADESSHRWSSMMPAAPSFIPWQGKHKVTVEQPEVEPPGEKGYWVRFVDDADRYVDADVMLSMPGTWPFLTERSEAGGYLELPKNQVERFGGGLVQYYEILARSERSRETAVAFWGVVRGPEEAVHAGDASWIRLRPARTMQVVVVDDDGAPIEGVFVRLSRESVGMLHLHMTTGADGRAEFSRIPRGDYYLTLDADGYARHTVRVEHGAESEQALKVVLDEGGGLRLPESWRGPLVEEMMRGRPAFSGGDAEGAGADEAAAEEAEASVGLEVYAADRRGGGVEGAYIEAWAKGERVATGVSAGRQPTTLKVPAGAEVSVIITHAGWGEGSQRVVDPAAGDEVVVRLDQRLFSVAVSDRVRRLSEIEGIVAAPLVDDGERWLLDRPQGESAAFSAGAQRGDSLLFLRRHGQSYRAVVERSGQIVEIDF